MRLGGGGRGHCAPQTPPPPRFANVFNSGKIWVILKDKYTHNTCQIYVKPHSKNTQITLESQIFDEKALR